MLDFLTFTDTGRSVLCLLKNHYLILLHHKALFCNGYREKVHRGYTEKKYKAFQDVEKSKTAKDVAAKCNLPRSSHLEGNEVKFLIQF